MKLNIKLDGAKFNLGLTLAALFTLAIVIELFLSYQYFYQNFAAAPIVIEEGNVVRVNLQSYDKTVNYIKGLNEYQAPELNLPRANIFR